MGADELSLHLRFDVLDSLWRCPTWLGSGCISHEVMERFRRLGLKLPPRSLLPSQHSETTCPAAGITAAFFLEILWLRCLHLCLSRDLPDVSSSSCWQFQSYHLKVVHDHLMVSLNVRQCFVLFEIRSHFAALAGLKPAILSVHKIHHINENIIKPLWRAS